MPEGESVAGTEPGPGADGDVGSLGEDGDESGSDGTVDPVGNSSVATTSLLASDCAVFSLSAIVIRLGLALEFGPALEVVSVSAAAAERDSPSGHELGLALEFELESDTSPCSPSGLVDRSSGRRAVSGHSSNDPSSPDSAISADKSPSELASAAAADAVSEEEGDEEEEEDPVDGHADDSSTDASASSLETQSRTVSAAREVIPLESDSDSTSDFDADADFDFDPVFTESDGCSAAEFRPALESAADPIADDGVN
ncbi:hypothetical protein C484_16284 [Natrialba taiwanensis DSM 12281]|uniref:Uncharacterized protein n=1 Tax=Natrialba taiwanensis DSM 12281 TaxID=1230458 RepID=L9ZPJ6_9EURY|nr:hypothetical protein C484_16284 [Natrialba taiwanensis DSM 12281]